MDIKFAAIYIIIPTLLIVLAIMFKLTVNRNINKIVLQILLLELPTEIIFLAISFIVSYILYGLDSSFANISDLDRRKLPSSYRFSYLWYILWLHLLFLHYVDIQFARLNLKKFLLSGMDSAPHYPTHLLWGLT